MAGFESQDVGEASNKSDGAERLGRVKEQSAYPSAGNAVERQGKESMYCSAAHPSKPCSRWRIFRTSGEDSHSCS